MLIIKRLACTVKCRGPVELRGARLLRWISADRSAGTGRRGGGHLDGRGPTVPSATAAIPDSRVEDLERQVEKLKRARDSLLKEKNVLVMAETFKLFHTTIRTIGQSGGDGREGAKVVAVRLLKHHDISLDDMFKMDSIKIVRNSIAHPKVHLPLRSSHGDLDDLDYQPACVLPAEAIRIYNSVCAFLSDATKLGLAADGPVSLQLDANLRRNGSLAAKNLNISTNAGVSRNFTTQMRPNSEVCPTLKGSST